VFYHLAAPLLYDAPIVADITSFFLHCDNALSDHLDDEGQNQQDTSPRMLGGRTKANCLRHVKTLHLIYRHIPVDTPEFEMVVMGPLEKTAAVSEVEAAEEVAERLRSASAHAHELLPNLNTVTIGKWGDRGWAWREERIHLPGAPELVHDKLCVPRKALPLILYDLPTLREWHQHVSAGPLAFGDSSTLFRRNAVQLREFSAVIEDLDHIPPLAIGSRNVVAIRPRWKNHRMKLKEYLAKLGKDLSSLLDTKGAISPHESNEDLLSQTTAEISVKVQSSRPVWDRMSDLAQNASHGETISTMVYAVLMNTDPDEEWTEELEYVLEADLGRMQKLLDQAVAEEWKGRVVVGGGLEG
jgi:hypothetical protein